MPEPILDSNDGCCHASAGLEGRHSAHISGFAAPVCHRLHAVIYLCIFKQCLELVATKLQASRARISPRAPETSRIHVMKFGCHMDLYISRVILRGL